MLNGNTRAERMVSGGGIDYSAEYERYRSEGLTAEQALDRLVAEHNVLLRGSVVIEPDEFVRPTKGSDTRLCATNIAAIALLNALFAKDGDPIFEYPFYIDDDHPLSLKIKGINENTARESGFVYVLEKKRFFNIPMATWQYISYKTETPYLARIDVSREDFTYPVYDIDNQTRLQ